MGGSGSPDYSAVIKQSLAQSNLPKSPLAGEYSGILGNAAPNLFDALTNIQRLGNSYINTTGTTASGTGVPNANPGGVLGSYGQGIPQSVVANDWNNVFAQGRNLIPSNGPTGTPGTGQGGQTFQPDSANAAPGVGGAPAGYNAQSYGDYASRQAISQMSPQQIQAQLQALQQKYAGQTFYGSTDANGNISATNYRPGPNGGAWIDPVTGQLAPSGNYTTSTDPLDVYQGQDRYDYGYLNQLASASPQMLPYLQSSQFVNGGPLTNPDGSPLFGETTPGNNVFGGPNTVQVPSNGSQPFYSIQNGQYVDQNGNPIPGMNPTSPGGGGNGVNLGPTGLPNGVNIQGPQAFNGQGAVAGLLNSLGTQGTNLSPTIQNLLGSLNNLQTPQANLSGIPNGTQLTPQTSQGFDAISQILNNQLTKNIADTREAALQQGTARSTGESYAEAQLKSQAIPQLAAALSGLNQQAVGNQLQSAGLQQQGALANAGLAGQYGLSAPNLSSLLNGLTGTQLGQNQLNVSGNTSLANILSNIGLTNTGQQNAFNLQTGLANSQNAQSTINNQMSLLSQLFNSGLSLAGAGIPGGSANVNVSNVNPSGGGLGGTLGGIGSILGAILPFVS